jgi:hypothetical protein
MTSTKAPELAVNMILPAPLVRQGGSTALVRGVTQSINGLLQTLGIPGTAVVELTIDDAGLAADWLPVLTIAGRVCPYPSSIWRRMADCTSGHPYGHTPADESPLVQVLTLGPAAVRHFVAAWVEAVCQQQPAMLWTPAAAAVYRTQLASTRKGDLPDAETLYAICAPVLGLRIALGDLAVVGEQLNTVQGAGGDVVTASEALIAALRPQMIEVQLSRAYLKTITQHTEASAQGVFRLMRDGLFYELGLSLPPIRLVPTARNGGRFRFVINHLPTPLWQGLPPEQLMVNVAPDEVQRKDMASELAVHPADGHASAIVDATARPQVDANGWNVWDPLNYLVLALYAEARSCAACFLDHTTLESMLTSIAPAYPRLVDAVHTATSLPHTTQVLRHLVAERVSIRDLRRVLQAILDFDTVTASTQHVLVFDSRYALSTAPGGSSHGQPMQQAAYVRTQLRRAVSHGASGSDNTLTVLQVEAGLDAVLAGLDLQTSLDLRRLDETLRRRVLTAVHDTLARLPAGLKPDAVLASLHARSVLQTILGVAFPDLPVLAYQERAPEWQVQKVETIQLPGVEHTS